MEETGSKKNSNSDHNAGSKGHSSPGRAMARWNALKHGILSQCAILPTEDRSEFEGLIDHLREDRKPQGALEELLVEKVAVCFWRLRRVLGYESEDNRKSAAQSAAEGNGIDDTSIKESGDVRGKLSTDKPIDPEKVVTLIIRDNTPEQSRTALSDVKRTETLLRYESAIERQLYRAIDQLERLQRQRGGEYVPPPVKIGLSSGS